MHPETIAVVDPRTAALLCRHTDQLEVAWREARDESALAYLHWSESPAEGRRLAYAVFLAAADREATAERCFLDAVELAQRR